MTIGKRYAMEVKQDIKQFRSLAPDNGLPIISFWLLSGMNKPGTLLTYQLF
jgi:hypothetical protein